MIRRLLPRPNQIIRDEKIKSALVSTTSVLMNANKSPDDRFKELFADVQKSAVYADGKTFVDLVPRKRAREILKEYRLAKRDPDFDLREFVSRHFYEFAPQGKIEYVVADGTTARQHVRNLWKVLERRNRRNRGSLFAIPQKYIVPGGRFQELFYWDTYFIMLGLAADDRWEVISGMMKNYAFMIRRFGFIPTANRTYFLSRSQPPFFSHMVRLLAERRGVSRTYFEFLPSLLAEYRFWMKGRRTIGDGSRPRSYARVVYLPDRSVLNRYSDNRATPRPEMMRDDESIASRARNLDKDKMFLDFRAAAESGWDFSSRWFRDPKEIQTIHTTDMVAVDLNCLLYQHESLIAEIYEHMRQPMLRRKFQRLADKRADSIRKYCWDENEQFFCDYDFRTGQSTGRLTLAGVFPLYAHIATAEQAQAVAERIERDFLQEGGVVATLVNNGEQWDWPNGWAPLQWVTVQGLREYGYFELANKIRNRWVHANEQTFKEKRKMLEKYDVVSAGRAGAGGEYPVQDGFGWTNGVYAVFRDEMDAEG